MISVQRIGIKHFRHCLILSDGAVLFSDNINLNVVFYVVTCFDLPQLGYVVNNACVDALYQIRIGSLLITLNWGCQWIVGVTTVTTENCDCCGKLMIESHSIGKLSI